MYGAACLQSQDSGDEDQRLWIWGYPELYNKFKTTLGFVARLYLNKLINASKPHAYIGEKYQNSMYMHKDSMYVVEICHFFLYKLKALISYSFLLCLAKVYYMTGA